MNFKPMYLIGMRSDSKQLNQPLAVGCPKHLEHEPTLMLHAFFCLGLNKTK